MLLSKLLPNLTGRDFDLICVGESIRQLVCSVVSIVYAAGCSGRILLSTEVIYMYSVGFVEYPLCSGQQSLDCRLLNLRTLCSYFTIPSVRTGPTTTGWSSRGSCFGLAWLVVTAPWLWRWPFLVITRPFC